MKIRMRAVKPEETEESGEDRLSLGFPDARRANRVPWNRTIEVVSPTQIKGKTVNASAVGILLTVEQDAGFEIGAPIHLLISDETWPAELELEGKIVRVEKEGELQRIAVNLLV